MNLVAYLFDILSKHKIKKECVIYIHNTTVRLLFHLNIVMRDSEETVKLKLM